MTTRNFDALFRPQSVALIGASIKLGSVGYILGRNLRSAGFGGPVWLVNPKYGDIEGHPCHPSVADLPSAPDLAIIATPPETIPELISQLGARGTRAVVVITAGVRGELKNMMLEASRPTLLRIQGPNCVGLLLPHIGLNASFSPQPLTGDIAFVSQSGALITGIIDWAKARNVGFSHVISLGDMADVDFGDLLDHLGADTKCRAILLYMESLTHAPKFTSAARRAARSKPVIVVKSGRSATGARAAHSHTGALAGSDAAYEAAFRRAGLLRVRELGDLFSAAEILARHPTFTGERLAILTNGGGAAVMATDHLTHSGGRLAELSKGTIAALEEVLPSTWSKGNPVDIIGDADAERYHRSLDILLKADDTDAVLVMNCPTSLTSNIVIAEHVVETVEAHRRTNGPKAVITVWLGEAASQDARTLFASNDIAAFETPEDGADAFMHLVNRARVREQLLHTPPSVPELTFDRGKADEILGGALASGRSALTEVEAKLLLTAYGIPVVPTDIALNPQDVERLATAILADHASCVIKILSDDISHKSDVGGVRLALESAQEARAAAESMLRRVAELRPHAIIQGFTVQPMVTRRNAHELILGMSVDPTFGPLMMFGAGGIAVEVMRDTAHALPPLDFNLARELMQRTRIWSLLQGYRGHPAADIERIAECLVRLSYLVAHHPQVRELDINPLLAAAHGLVALDARVKVVDPTIEPRVRMAIRAYPSEWISDIEVGCVGRVRLRPIRPEDKALYQTFFCNVTAEDRRLRFFGAGQKLEGSFFAQLTQIDYAREMAFVAISRDSGALLGVVRLVVDSSYERGEFAILVRSDLKGRGLGWCLMEHVIKYARSEKLHEVQGLALAGNTRILQMSRELGFSVSIDPGDVAIHRMTLDLKSSAL
jgi:acetyltransferase